MDELLIRARVPLDGTMYVGKLMSEPFLRRALNARIGPAYSLHVRPLFRSTLVWGSEGEMVLASGQRVPAHIVSTARITPSPQAVESGFWKPDDAHFSILDTDLTPEQAREARYFIQPCSPRIERPMRSEEEFEVADI